MRHNEIRDITADLLTEVCHGVGTEPHLQPITEEQLSYRSANREEGARLDIVAENFWGRDRQRSFFDVRVFNPHARTQHLHNASEGMNLRREEPTMSVSGKLNMEASPLLFSPPRAAWGQLQQLYTRD